MVYSHLPQRYCCKEDGYAHLRRSFLQQCAHVVPWSVSDRTQDEVHQTEQCQAVQHDQTEGGTILSRHKYNLIEDHLEVVDEVADLCLSDVSFVEGDAIESYFIGEFATELVVSGSFIEQHDATQSVDEETEVSDEKESE